jgi:hypothetical protein
VIPRLFPASTIACVGGGPSLTAADVARLRGHVRVIAINDAYRLAPWADVLYACDAAWWRVHRGVPAFRGVKVSLGTPPASPDGIVRLANTGVDGLELAADGLRTGGNSGYQAINLAVHLGARIILLLGYDLQRAATGRAHWFGDHPGCLNQRSPYASFRRHFATLIAPLAALGITIINCSRQTALTCFPCQPLDAWVPCCAS